MPQQAKQNLPTPVFVVMLFFMTVGFGSHWNCHVQYRPGCGCVPPPADRPSTTPPPDAGCINSQPNYTTGPRMRGEFTVSVREFTPRQHSLAYEFAALLRRRRINNYIFQRKNNNWVVAVGRYTTFDQAEKMKQSLIERGFVNAEVFTPLGDIIEKIEPQPVCGCY
jgi:hypothetical protein